MTARTRCAATAATTSSAAGPATTPATTRRRVRRRLVQSSIRTTAPTCCRADRASTPCARSRASMQVGSSLTLHDGLANDGLPSQNANILGDRGRHHRRRTRHRPRDRRGEHHHDARQRGRRRRLRRRGLHLARSQDDIVQARDGYRDRIQCGSGTDTAAVDQLDVLSGCENVATEFVTPAGTPAPIVRPPAPPPPAPPPPGAPPPPAPGAAEYTIAPKCVLSVPRTLANARRQLVVRQVCNEPRSTLVTLSAALRGVVVAARVGEVTLAERSLSRRSGQARVTLRIPARFAARLAGGLAADAARAIDGRGRQRDERLADRAAAPPVAPRHRQRRVTQPNACGYQGRIRAPELRRRRVRPVPWRAMSAREQPQSAGTAFDPLPPGAAPPSLARSLVGRPRRRAALADRARAPARRPGLPRPRHPVGRRRAGAADPGLHGRRRVAEGHARVAGADRLRRPRVRHRVQRRLLGSDARRARAAGRRRSRRRAAAGSRCSATAAAGTSSRRWRAGGPS